MWSVIQNIFLSFIFGAIGAAIFTLFIQHHLPVIGTVDTVAIIDPIKKQMVKNILNQKDKYGIPELKLEQLNKIMAELGKEGITLIEKKAIITKGLIHDYTREIQKRMGE